MKPASHYAERALNLAYSRDQVTLEGLFAEAQADALKHALDKLNVSESLFDWHWDELQEEANRLRKSVHDY